MYQQSPKYANTNESLAALVAGLEPSPKDNILSVAGSGDQAFALLESGARVRVVDIVPEHLAYVRRRAAFLKLGEFENFLSVGRNPDHDSIAARLWEDENHVARAYFADEGYQRLEKIKANARNLSLGQPADILEVTKQGDFSKIYLSNAIGYESCHFDRAGLQKALVGIAEALPEGGLIYVSNHNLIALSIRHSEDPLAEISDTCEENADIRETSFLPKSLILDEARTLDARSKASDWHNKWWKLAVYRKVT